MSPVPSREFTPIERAVTDRVTRKLSVPATADQYESVEQMIEYILTVRQLLVAADSTQFIKSQRLELIAEATALVNKVIEEMSAKNLRTGLERLRMECADQFIEVAEEVPAIPTGLQKC